MHDSTLFQLSWKRDREGYETDMIAARGPSTSNSLSLLRGEDDEHPVIKPKSGNFDNYDPFEYETSVAREFSQLDTELIENEKIQVNRKSAQAFANKYGLLGLHVLNPEDPKEDLRQWGRFVIFFLHIFEKIDNKETKEAAEIFNNKELTQQRLMSPKITDGASSSQRQIQIKPATLLSAMILMLADEVTKGVQMQPCQNAQCRRWFPIRPNKKTCSDACKQALHRSRNAIR